MFFFLFNVVGSPEKNSKEASPATGSVCAGGKRAFVFVASVLEPDFDLRFAELQSARQFAPFTTR